MKLQCAEQLRILQVLRISHYQLYQASGGDRVTAEGIEAAYATVTGKTLQKSLDTSGEMSKEVHNGLRSFALRTGSAGQEGAIFLNGKFLDLNDVRLNCYRRAADPLHKQSAHTTGVATIHDHYLLPNVGVLDQQCQYIQLIKNFAISFLTLLLLGLHRPNKRRH